LSDVKKEGSGPPRPGGMPGRSLPHGEDESHVSTKNCKVVKSTEEFKHELSASPKSLVVVDFFATWCVPCKHIAPKFAELSEKHTNVRFLKVDVDALREVAGEAGIGAIPTFHFYKGGSKIDELQGGDPGKLEELVRKHSAGSVLSGGDSQFAGQGHRLGGSDVSSSLSKEAQLYLPSLLELGFSKEQATLGLEQTNCEGVEQAIEWLLAHPQLAVQNPTSTTAMPSATVGIAPSSASGKTVLNIRLTNGSTMKAEFGAADTLRAVRNHIDRTRTDGYSGYELLNSYPRKVFSTEVLDATLAELGLVPNATLVMHRI